MDIYKKKFEFTEKLTLNENKYLEIFSIFNNFDVEIKFKLVDTKNDKEIIFNKSSWNKIKSSEKNIVKSLKKKINITRREDGVEKIFVEQDLEITVQELYDARGLFFKQNLTEIRLMLSTFSYLTGNFFKIFEIGQFIQKKINISAENFIKLNIQSEHDSVLTNARKKKC